MSGKLEIILCCNAAPETSSHYHVSVSTDSKITQLSVWLSKEVYGGLFTTMGRGVYCELKIDR